MKVSLRGADWLSDLLAREVTVVGGLQGRSRRSGASPRRAGILNAIARSALSVEFDSVVVYLSSVTLQLEIDLSGLSSDDLDPSHTWVLCSCLFSSLEEVKSGQTTITILQMTTALLMLTFDPAFRDFYDGR